MSVTTSTIFVDMIIWTIVVISSPTSYPGFLNVCTKLLYFKILRLYFILPTWLSVSNVYFINENRNFLFFSVRWFYEMLFTILFGPDTLLKVLSLQYRYTGTSYLILCEVLYLERSHFSEQHFFGKIENLKCVLYN